MDVISGKGATKERRQHSKITSGYRSNDAGNFGDMDTEHCTLDWLRENGHLGREHNDIEDRYWSGYKLRKTYYTWKASGKSMMDVFSGKPSAQFESDEPTASDTAEEQFHAIMRALPVKYHGTVRLICIDSLNGLPTDKNGSIGESVMWEIHDSLDALHGAIKRAEEKLDTPS